MAAAGHLTRVQAPPLPCGRWGSVLAGLLVHMWWKFSQSSQPRQGKCKVLGRTGRTKLQAHLVPWGFLAAAAAGPEEPSHAMSAIFKAAA